MNKLIKTAAIALLVAFASAGTASAQLANGSFELGSQDPGAFWITLGPGATVMNGWTVDAGEVDYIGGWWPASDGTKSIDMNGRFAGQISQIFPTTPGVTYALSFDMSGNADGAPAIKLMSVTANGGHTQTYAYDTSLAGASRSDMKWERNVYTFVAESDFTLLVFKSDVEGFFGPTLDNVQILSGVCHRNFGKKGSQTLMVDPHAVGAHLAHGDTPGPCEQ